VVMVSPPRAAAAVSRVADVKVAAARVSRVR
jgi:hypothetical protein